MKLDKDWILKHRFWLLLGTFGALWLTSLIALFTLGGGPYATANDALEAARKAIKPYAVTSGDARPKNDSFLPKWVDWGNMFKAQKNTVWGVAFFGDPSDPVLKSADADAPGKGPEDPKLVRHVFRNGAWEVTLLFDRPAPDQPWRVKPESSVKNIDEDGLDQPLSTPDDPDGVQFRLRQGNAVALIAFAGPPVPPDQKRTLAEGNAKDGAPVKDVDPQQPVQLEQLVAQHWKGQAGMYVWPDDVRLPNGEAGPGEHKLNELLPYPTRPFDVVQRDWYKGSAKFSPYRYQFDKLYFELKSTAPPTVPPAGLPLDAVAFKGGDRSKGGDYYGVMKPVDINSKDVTNSPDPEECWLMQEDFWVKREALYVVRDALSLAAHMDAVQPPDDASAADPKVLGRRVFRNDSWEVTLLFDRTDDNKWRIRPDSSIKNVSVNHRDQNLGNPALHNGGVWFRLSEGDADHPTPVVVFAFEGQRLPWDQHSTLADGTYKDGWPLTNASDWSTTGGLDPAKPLHLEQVFDTTNTPITEIDDIKIAKVSHKNANRALVAAKPERYGMKPPAPADSKTPGAPGATGAPPMPGGTPGGALPGNTSGGMPGPGPNGAGGPTGTGATAANLTPNYKLDRNRYLFVTDQSRHLPLAVTLTVDQSHLHELLAAFANSRLRFQTTQVEFRRVPAGPGGASATPGPNGVPADNTNPTPPGGTTGRPLMPAVPMPGPGGSTTGPSPISGPSGIPPGMNPNGPASGAAPAEPDNPNLIEVTVYGIASLYERPPEAK